MTHYDGCYLPNGQIACVSNACEQAVPCTGGGDVGNMHLIERRRHERAPRVASTRTTTGTRP